MIKLRMFSYNFAYTIMSDILYLKNQTKASIHQKKSLIVNLIGKLQKPFDFFSRCQTRRRIWLVQLLVEIPRGFELPRNWSIQLR